MKHKILSWKEAFDIWKNQSLTYAIWKYIKSLLSKTTTTDNNYNINLTKKIALCPKPNIIIMGI